MRLPELDKFKGKTVAIVMGTRPEVIKLASVVSALVKFPAINTVIINLGQHREMILQALETFEIKPDVDLALMEENQSLTSFTAKAIPILDSLYAETKPDIVVVQGDTTTAMVAALCAFYRKIPVCHVEAGLRTFDMFHPFPEEVNRRIISAATTLHCCPTNRARDNLLHEGISRESIFLTGNTVIDALNRVKKNEYMFKTAVLNTLDFEKKIIVVTVHRRENHGAPLKEICRALRDLTAMYPDIVIVYPVHLNPNVSQAVHQMLENCPGVYLIPPIPYEDQVNLMARCYLLLTDSGGLQEEAPSLGKPVLVLRKTTERPEAVERGHARLIGSHYPTIVEETSRLLNDPAAYEQMARCSDLFGDGRAGERIAEYIMHRCAPTQPMQRGPVDFNEPLGVAAADK
jgi:UDP-N-acetylglucosamine 2-epimerase (non-hydrolysing)